MSFLPKDVFGRPTAPKIVKTESYKPVMGMWGKDPSKWASPKDLSDYPVEKVLANNDPDWLVRNADYPDFNNAFAQTPKPLREDSLKLWRTEPLRPARPKPRGLSSSHSFSATMRFDDEGLESSIGAHVATLASTVDSWTSRTFGEKPTTAASRTFSEKPTTAGATTTAASTATEWSRTVRPKLEPMQLSMRSSSTPLLFVKGASPCEDPCHSNFYRGVTKFGYRKHKNMADTRDESAAGLERARASDPRYAPVWRQRSIEKLSDCIVLGPEASGAAQAALLDSIIADCDEAIRLDMTHAGSWAKRADAKLMKGDWEGAKRDCDEAIFRDRKIPRVWLTRGTAKCQLGDLNGSFEDCERALRLDCRVAEHWTGRAAGRLRAEDFLGAEEDCSEAIRLDVHQIAAWVTRAGARNGLGKYEAAIADCDRAIHIDDYEAKQRGEFAEAGCVPALAHRAYAKIFLNDYVGSIADSSRAIALREYMGKPYAPAYTTRGEAKYESGDFQAAIADFDRAISIDEKHARAWWYRGLAYLAMGKYENARADNEQAYILEPRIVDAGRKAHVAAAHSHTVSAWKLPITQLGLHGELERQEKYRREYQGRA